MIGRLLRPCLKRGTPGIACLTLSPKRWVTNGTEPVTTRSTIFTTRPNFVAGKGTDAIPTYRVLDQEGEVIGEAPDLAENELLEIYRAMVFISIMDRIMFDAQRQGNISFYLMSAGEEGIAVGSASALRSNDVVFAQYRETGVFRYRGFTASDFMHQLFATEEDPGKGRNMPVQYGSRRLHVHTISAPLATQIPQAAGAAYALKLRANISPSEPKRVVACYFGEGAASEGDFHAGLNIAATRECPVLFICRNNGYAISTPSREQYRSDGIASRGVGYGIDTIRVDGNDPLAMHHAVKLARQRAIGGHRSQPVLIEAMSYRVAHHSTSDDSFAYRSKAEVAEWQRQSDPISRLRKFMERQGMWNTEREAALRRELKAEVLAAYRDAQKAKGPALRNMMMDVYQDMTEEQAEQWEALQTILKEYPEEYDLSKFGSE